MNLFQSLLVATLTTFAHALPAQGGPGVTVQRVGFNSSSGVRLVGYHHSPSSQSGPIPIVVIAHGLGGLQSGLQKFADRFAGAGYHALTFDYRTWGESDGKPRNIIDISDQQDDYKTAIAAAKTLPGVDPSRVVIWGSSLSGGHVLELGVQIPSLSGVIAQVPHVNGAATVGEVPSASLPGLVAMALEDQGRPLLGLDPIYIPLANYTGQLGALTQAGAKEGYDFVLPNPPPPGNVAAARFILQLPTFNPDFTAADSKVPTFIGVAVEDNVCPAPPAIALGNKLQATLKAYNGGGHFDVYPGAKLYEPMINDQIAFLRKTLPLRQ